MHAYVCRHSVELACANSEVASAWPKSSWAQENTQNNPMLDHMIQENERLAEKQIAPAG